MGHRVRVEDVSMAYGAHQVLSSLNIEVGSGEFVSLLGPSGCGKSTLLELIGGLRKASTGTIVVDQTVVTGPLRTTGIVFQEDTTLPWRNVIDNVAFAAEMHGTRRADARKLASAAIKSVGLAGFERHRPAELSGGMRQRVAFARMLTTQPQLVLADEPFGALDEQTRLVMGTELLNAIEETDATVLLVTHSIQEAVLLSDRILVMGTSPGRIVETIDVTLSQPRTPELLGDPTAANLVQRAWEPLRSASDTALDRAR